MTNRRKFLQLGILASIARLLGIKPGIATSTPISTERVTIPRKLGKNINVFVDKLPRTVILRKNIRFTIDTNGARSIQ